MKLSENIVTDLKELEAIIQAGNESEIEEACSDILLQYGSHVHMGDLELGGIYLWTASSTFSIEKDNTKRTREILNTALNGMVSSSYSGLGISILGEITSDLARNDLKGLLSDVDLTKVSMGILQFGGLQNVTSFPHWKMSLYKHNSSLAVINRSISTPSHLVSIWDMIQNAPELFTNPELLADSLKQTWSVISGLAALKADVVTYQETLDQLSTIVHNWNTDVEFPTNAVKYLETLLDTLEQYYLRPECVEYLLGMLKTDNDLDDFFHHVMDITHGYTTGDIQNLNGLLSRFLESFSSEVFPLKKKVFNFLMLNKEVEKCLPRILEVCDIKDVCSFLRAVREVLIPEFEAEEASDPSNHEGHKGSCSSVESVEKLVYMNGKLTREVASMVEHLITIMEAHNKQYESFILKVIVQNYTYDLERRVFQSSLTEQSVSKLTQQLEGITEEFSIYAKKSEVEKQAFLIHYLIVSLPENIAMREHQFMNMLGEIQGTLHTNIAVVIARFTSSIPFYWDGLLSALEELKKGNRSVLENEAVTITALNEILLIDDPTEKTIVWDNENVCEVPEEGTHAGKLLLQLGLAPYYPSKISLQDVMSIGNNNFSLPWRILQRLIMLDFNARDSEPGKSAMTKDGKDSEPDSTENWTVEGLLDDFVCDETQDESLNPLDIFLVIYACCDMLLKQVIVQKMFMCRLALPFLWPHPGTNSLVFSLWAFRTIIVECRNKDQECVEASLVSQPVKLVSFVRMKRPSCSKSTLLNNILSNQAHHTFWNHESPQGNSEHAIANGLLEVQSYLPSGKAGDYFDEVTMFLNLRGDAILHTRQLEFLQKISNVVVCALDVFVLSDPNVLEAMVEIHSTSAKTILILAAKDPAAISLQLLKQSLNQYCEYMGKSNMENTKIILGAKGNKVRTIEDLKQELRSTLNKFLSDQQGMPLEELASYASVHNFIVDEDDEVCLKAKTYAREVVSCLNGRDINECKRELLPLQGEDLAKWSKLLKDKQLSGLKGSNQGIQDKGKIQSSMTQIRKRQLEICNNLNDMMTMFVKNLLEVIETPAAVIYMQWLKIYLDDISRSTLPGLHRDYHKKWLALYDSMQKTKDVAHLKAELEHAEKMVAEASFGVEHLLREVSQIYEATLESKMHIAQTTRNIVDELPRVVAKLLLKGHPVEVMDGDTANVPLTWVKAVFSSLTEQAGDKKLFIISVLGIQSSGKSTLLNTMFGLQFAVSAGRCTRGVYMQLVKKDPSRTDLPYEYVLVIDTEGLRAPELGQLKHDNDNQLATFVIGLGDLTILNIKGENVVEVSDVLQIAVHAFLRMKIVSNNFQLHRTCVFIHQNVPAINAKEKMQHGCKKLKEKLDEMTREASAIENIVDINTFSDVIAFDGDSNVWYFSDLWHGDPPMAPPNPGYMEKVKEVKNSILTELTRKQKSFLSFNDMKIRVDDLWKGVLSESFVFSFRNSLAAKAYNSMERIYQEKTWDIESAINKWTVEKGIVQLERCSTGEDLHKCCIEVMKDLRSTTTELLGSCLADLEHFFDHHNLKDILIDWKVPKIEGLKNDTSVYLERAKSQIRQKKELLRLELLEKNKDGDVHVEIMKKAKKAAEEIKGEQVPESELFRQFNIFWRERETEYATCRPTNEVDIVGAVYSQLIKHFEKDGRALQEELNVQNIETPLKIKQLRGSIIFKDIDDAHLSVNKSMWQTVKGAVMSVVGTQPQVPMKCRREACQVINNILTNVDNALAELKKLNSAFQVYSVNIVIKTVIDGIEEHNASCKQPSFTILPNLVAKIVVHVCRHAIGVFKAIQRDYDANHAYERKLEGLKNMAWALYRNTVYQCKFEMIVADLVTNHLEKLVWEAVKNRMSGEVVNYVVRYFSQTKFHLIVRILSDLTAGPFADYLAYIADAKEFALSWLTTFMNEEVFLAPKNGTSKYVGFAEQNVYKLTQSVRRGLQKTTEHTKHRVSQEEGMKFWVDSFCNEVQDLPLKKEDLKAVLEQPVEDFKNLEERIQEKLNQVEQNIIDSFAAQKIEDMKWDGKTPYMLVIDRLWGCEAQCPFCAEVCQRSDPNHLSPHDAHQCLQHRMDGVNGYHWDVLRQDDRTLTLESCNYNVQSDFTFFQDGDNHPYKRYKEKEPDWDIAPSSSMESSKYWMWFMATYSKELAIHYQCAAPIIPQSWYDITLDEALDSLREYYC